MSSRTLEVNFDGLVGPTHNYAGLGQGNLASQANQRKPANPKQAALQGLEKMRLVAELGVTQAVLPPQTRPDLAWLRKLGFRGSDAVIITEAANADPSLLASCYSASAMWTANAATVSPSADSGDGRVHFTPANLSSQIHRSVEAPHTAALLKKLFPGKRFVHHDPLPAGIHFGDEGAANHMRLAPSHGSPGLQIFVYGHSTRGADTLKAKKTLISPCDPLLSGTIPDTVTPRFFPRQSLEASQAVARLHGLREDRVIFVAQNPAAINAGVFHNDVISVANGNVLFCHESAFLNQAQVLQEIRRKYAAMMREFSSVSGSKPASSSPSTKMASLKIIEVPAQAVSLETAVSTYLFNSQLLTLPSGDMLLLAAMECREHPATRKYLDALPGRGLGITQVTFADLRQSMRNGGGPACLRLRVALTEKELAAVPEGVKFTDTLHRRLQVWVEKHYRDRLLPRDLADLELAKESRTALSELNRILKLTEDLQ